MLKYTIPMMMFFAMLGSVGGMELGVYSATRGFVQSLVFMGLMVLSYRICAEIDRRSADHD